MNPQQTLRKVFIQRAIEFAAKNNEAIDGTVATIMHLIDQESLRRSVADRRELLERLKNLAVELDNDITVSKPGTLLDILNFSNVELKKLKTLEGQDE